MMDLKKHVMHAGVVVGLSLSLTGLISCQSPNIITEVVGAPTVAGGLVGGQATNINIMFAKGAALDPNVRGLQIPAGGHMEIEMVRGFARTGPELDDPSREFVKIDSNATVVLGTGLPQNPIVATDGTGVQHGNYTIGGNDNHVIKITPVGGTGPNGLKNLRATDIGVKSIHIRPNGNRPPFINGPVGAEGVVDVRIFSSAKKVIKSGSYTVTFEAPPTGPVIYKNNEGYTTPLQTSPNTTSTLAVESVDFQHVPPSASLNLRDQIVPMDPQGLYALQFILFDANQPDDFIPMKGIPGVGYWRDDQSKIVHTATLYQDTTGVVGAVPDPTDTAIGTVTVKGPRGSTPKIVPFFSPVLTVSGDGITGAHGSTLRIGVEVGYQPGPYYVTVDLDNGGSATSVIIVD